MKKVIISTDVEAKKRNTYILELKKDITTKAVQFFKSHSLAVKTSKLENGEFLQVFNELFSSTYLDALPNSIGVAQRMKLLDIDTTRLEQLQREFNSYTTLDNDHDYNTYATTPRQLEKYTSVLNLKRSFEEFLIINHNWVNNSYARYISDATKDALLWRNGKLEVNIRGYVLNEDI